MKLTREVLEARREEIRAASAELRANAEAQLNAYAGHLGELEFLLSLTSEDETKKKRRSKEGKKKT